MNNTLNPPVAYTSAFPPIPADTMGLLIHKAVAWAGTLGAPVCIIQYKTVPPALHPESIMRQIPTGATDRIVVTVQPCGRIDYRDQGAV